MLNNIEFRKWCHRLDMNSQFAQIKWHCHTQTVVRFWGNTERCTRSLMVRTLNLLGRGNGNLNSHESLRIMAEFLKAEKIVDIPNR